MKKFAFMLVLLAMAGILMGQIPGSTVQNPMIFNLPIVNYQDNTQAYGNNYTSAMVTPSFNYLGGYDFVVQFTLTGPENILSGSVSGSWIGLIIVSQEPSIGTPAPRLGIASGSNGGSLSPVTLPAGTYYAIVSTWPSPDYTAFTLNLSAVVVTPQPSPANVVAPLNESINRPLNQNLTWSAGGGSAPTGYKVHFGTTNPPEFIGDLGLVTTWTPTQALQYSTTYYWQIIPYNQHGDAVADCPVWSFTTMADPIISQFPWVEGFDTWPALNWTQFSGILSENTPVAVGSNWQHHQFGNTGGVNNSAYVNIYDVRNHWLVTPPINLDADPGLKQLEFDIALTPWTGTAQSTLGPDDYVAVVISTDNGQTWSNANVLIDWDSTDTISPTGDHYIVSLEGYTGLVKFGFYARRPSGYSPDLRFYVDNVQVRRTPTEAEFSITPELAVFPQTDVQSSRTQAFTVRNTGVNFLTISSATITGANANLFTVQNMPGLPANINNQQQINFNVRYLPTTPGNHEATLRLTDNLGRAVREIPLSGTAIQPPIGANVRFPHVVSLPVSGFTANTGAYLNYYTSAMISPSSTFLNGPEYVARFTLNSDSYVSGSTTGSTRIFIVSAEPNLTSAVPVLIGPSLSFTNQRLFAGTYYAIIAASSASDFTFSLSAEALPPNPVFAVNPETKDFGDVNVNSTANQQFTISNGAGGNLQIYAITIEGDNAFSLSQIPNLPANISFMPASNINFTVQYAPTTEGEHNATVRVFDSMNRAIQEIPLTGNGLSAETVLNFGFFEDFEGAGTLPQGWTGTMTVMNIHGTASSRGLSRNIYSSVPSGNAKTPVIGPVSVGTELTFDYRIVNWSGYPSTATPFGEGNTVQVKVNGNDVFVVNSANHVVTTDFAEITIDLSSFAGQSVEIEWICTWASGDYYVDIDNVSVMSLPQTLAVIPNSHNFGNIAVNSESPVKTFIVANAGLGSIQLNGVSIVNRNNDFVITEHAGYPFTLGENGSTFAEIGVKFTPATAGEKSAILRLTYEDAQTYDVEITGNAVGTIITTFPHHESFEDPAFPPIGWNLGAGNASNNWRIMNNITYAFEGNKSVMVGKDTGSYWLSTPGFEVTEQSKTLSFHVRKHTTVASWDKNDEYLQVYISTTGNTPASFTAQPVLDLGKDDLRLNYRKLYIDLENYIGQTIYVGFKRVATGGNFVYLDNFMINNDAPIFYGKPQNVQVTAGDGIVYINWEAPNTSSRSLQGYRVYRNNNAITNVITETSYIDTNVQNDVDYTYYVTAVYADYETSPTTPVMVVPSIPVGVFPPANLTYSVLGNYVNLNWENPTPFFEGFEHSIIPEGWQNVDQDNDGQSWYILTTQGQAFSGRRSVASASWTAATDALTPNNWLITPALTLKDNAVLSWAVGATNNQFFAEHYQVKISTTGSNISDFTTNLRTETLTTAQWRERSHNLSAYSGQTVYIAFVHNNSTEQSSLKLDNIMVTNVNNSEGSFASDFDTEEGLAAFSMLSGPSNRNLVFVTGYSVFRDGQVIASLASTEHNYIDPNLQPGFYQYQVFAHYGGMTSTPATVNVEVLPVLPVPQNLTYTADWNVINLDWEEPDFEAERSGRATFVGYRLYRNNQPISGVITTTSYSDTSLSAVPSYNYFVVAVFTNPNRESGPSNQVQITPMIPVYNPARNLTATPEYGLISLSWDAPFVHERSFARASSREVNNQVFENYTLYRNGEILVAEMTELTYADYDVVNGVNYSYSVKANYTNPVGQSVSSNLVTSTPVIPAPARNFTALAGDGIVELAWQAPVVNTNLADYFNGYYIYRNDLKLNEEPLETLEYADTLVVNYTSYTYFVTAVYENPQGEIESAPTVSRTVMPELLTPPSNLQATVLEYDVTLSWSAPQLNRNSRALLGYRVYRNGVRQNQQIITGRTFTNVNVPAGTHSYAVTAVYDAQESVAIELEVTVIPLGDYTFPPVNVTSTINGNNVTVRWRPPFTFTNDLSNLIGYNVYRNTAEPELLTESPISALRFTELNLNPGEHTYSVSAVYIINDEIAESELIASLPVVIDDLLPPTNLTYAINEYNVTLNWEAPAVELDRSVLSYKVYRNGILLTQNPVDVLTYTHVNAGIGIHWYAVSAVYSTGQSELLGIEVVLSPQIINEFPYVQGFEGNALPVGWKAPFTGVVAGAWRLRNNPTYAYQGYKSVMSGNNPGNYWLITTPVQITEDSKTLSFFARDHSALSHIDKTDEFLHIKISTTNDSLYNFTTVASLDYRSLTTQYQQFMVDLSDYLDQTVYVALQRVSTGGNYVYVDNFSFNAEELPVFNAVQNLVATAGENMINLTWEAPVEAEGHTLLAYRLYRNNAFIAEFDFETFVYNDASVQAFTAYEYVVKAIYTQGVAYSEAVQATPYTFNAPTNLVATSGNMQIALAWQAPVNTRDDVELTLMGYKIYRNSMLINVDDQLFTETAYTDNAVNANQTYFYRVKAVYNLGESGLSNQAQATPYQFFAPRELVAVAGVSNVRLVWQHSNSVIREENESRSSSFGQRFKIFRNEEEIAEVNNVRFYQDNAVEAGETYTYYVTAVYAQGQSLPSNEVEASPYAIMPPRELFAEGGNEVINLNWTAPLYMNEDFFVGYKVYRNGVAIADSLTVLEYVDSSVVPMVNYVYEVSAVYVQRESEKTAPAHAKAYNFAKPLNLVGRAGVERNRLTWSAPQAGIITNTGSRPEGYKVYRNGVAITEVISALTYTDVTVVAGTAYEYYITAVYANPAGESAASNMITLTPFAPVFNAPLNVDAQIVANNINITWETPVLRSSKDVDFETLTAYIVYRNNEAISEEINTMNFVDENIEAGVRYTYFVVAVYAGPDGVSEMSESVTVEKVNETDTTVVPLVTALSGNYPNPFNPETAIKFAVANDSNVKIDIYNAKGSLVKSLTNDNFKAGEYQLIWNGTDNHGRKVGSGIYFYRMQSENFSSTKKMILMK